MKIMGLKTRPLVRFGAYEFRPDQRAVGFLDRSIVMSEPEFDVALEIFFHAHRALGISELRRVLPARRGVAAGWSDEALLRWVQALPWALEMQRCGWELKTLGSDAVILSRLHRQRKAPGAGVCVATADGGRDARMPQSVEDETPDELPGELSSRCSYT